MSWLEFAGSQRSNERGLRRSYWCQSVNSVLPIDRQWGEGSIA
jgi:hypothetical protein